MSGRLARIAVVSSSVRDVGVHPTRLRTCDHAGKHAPRAVQIAMALIMTPNVGDQLQAKEARPLRMQRV